MRLLIVASQYYYINIEIKKSGLIKILQEALQKEYISKEEFQAMDPTEKSPGKFYELFKLHKERTPGETTPERPIIPEVAQLQKILASL